MNTVSEACKSYFQGFQDLNCKKKGDCAKNTVGFLKVLSYFSAVIPLMFTIIYACSALVGRICPQKVRKPIDQRIINLSQINLGSKNSQNNVVPPQPIPTMLPPQPIPATPPPQTAQIHSSTPTVLPQPSTASAPAQATPIAQAAAPVDPNKLVEYTESDLEEFFKSKHECQKLFLIKGNKVGIFYDPSGKRLEDFAMVTLPSVGVFANADLPKDILDIIRSQVPKGHEVEQWPAWIGISTPHASINTHLEALGFEGTYELMAPAPTFNKTFLTAQPTYTYKSKTAFDDEVQEFFTSTQKCKKLFQLNGQKVGVVFDPNGNGIDYPEVKIGSGAVYTISGGKTTTPIFMVYCESNNRKEEDQRAEMIKRMIRNHPHYWQNKAKTAATSMKINDDLMKAYGFYGPSKTDIAPTFKKEFTEPAKVAVPSK